MPQKRTTDKANERRDRATTGDPHTLTVSVQIPGWLAVQIDKIATDYGLRGQDVVVLACMTLQGGVAAGDKAWIDGLEKTKELLGR